LVAEEEDQDIESQDDVWSGVPTAQRRSYTLRLHCVGCSCGHQPVDVDDHLERLEALLGLENDDESKLPPAADAVVDRAAQQWRALETRVPCQAKMATLHALFDRSADVVTYDASDLPLPVLQQLPASSNAAPAASDSFSQWSSQADEGAADSNGDHAAGIREHPKRSLEVFRQMGITTPSVAAQLGNLIFAKDSHGHFACITFENPNSQSSPPNPRDEVAAAIAPPTVIKVKCNCEPSLIHFFCPLAAGVLKDLSGDAPSKVSFVLVML